MQSSLSKIAAVKLDLEVKLSGRSRQIAEFTVSGEFAGQSRTGVTL